MLLQCGFYWKKGHVFMQQSLLECHGKLFWEVLRDFQEQKALLGVELPR